MVWKSWSDNPENSLLIFTPRNIFIRLILNASNPFLNTLLSMTPKSIHRPWKVHSMLNSIASEALGVRVRHAIARETFIKRIVFNHTPYHLRCRARAIVFKFSLLNPINKFTLLFPLPSVVTRDSLMDFSLLKFFVFVLSCKFKATNTRRRWKRRKTRKANRVRRRLI